MVVKYETANLHITTLGHGYASNVHVDHKGARTHMQQAITSVC